MLKKICREHGIRRWPQRKLQSLNKMMNSIELAMRSAAEPDRERLRNELEVLRRRRQQIAPMYPDKRPPGSEEMGPEGVPGGVPPGFPPHAMMPPGYGGTVIHYAPHAVAAEPLAGDASLHGQPIVAGQAAPHPAMMHAAHAAGMHPYGGGYAPLSPVAPMHMADPAAAAAAAAAAMAPHHQAYAQRSAAGLPQMPAAAYYQAAASVPPSAQTYSNLAAHAAQLGRSQPYQHQAVYGHHPQSQPLLKQPASPIEAMLPGAYAMSHPGLPQAHMQGYPHPMQGYPHVPHHAPTYAAAAPFGAAGSNGQLQRQQSAGASGFPFDPFTVAATAQQVHSTHPPAANLPSAVGTPAHLLTQPAIMSTETATAAGQPDGQVGKMAHATTLVGIAPPVACGTVPATETPIFSGLQPNPTTPLDMSNKRPAEEAADDPSLTKKARAVPDSLTDLTGNEEGTSGTSAEASSGEFEGGD